MNLYFLHIPKTAGTSVMTWLQGLDYEVSGVKTLSLCHSWFKDTSYHGIRIGAGVRLKDEYDEFDTLPNKMGPGDPDCLTEIRIKDLQTAPVFTIVRDISTWLPSYYSSGQVGWHFCQAANKVEHCDDGSGWRKFCEKFDDSYNNGFPWYHCDWSDPANWLSKSRAGRFPANEWTRSNIWQLYDDDENLMVDYVINYNNLETGLNLMFEHLGIDLKANNLGRHNQNPWVERFDHRPEKIHEKHNFEHYKDSRVFFADDKNSLYIAKEEKCI